MALSQEDGCKTGKATPKKLRDARKRGEAATSRDVTSTLRLAFSLSLIFLGVGHASWEIADLIDYTLSLYEMPFDLLIMDAGTHAVRLFV